MQKHEVLSLLERFPDLVDNDDLLSDLFQQATADMPTNERSAKHAAHQTAPIRDGQRSGGSAAPGLTESPSDSAHRFRDSLTARRCSRARGQWVRCGRRRPE